MIGKRLQELRKAKKLSTTDVAGSIGIKPRTYVSYEAEEREPNITTINTLADFYGVTTDYLLGREHADPIGQLTPIEIEREVLTEYFKLPADVRTGILEAMRKVLTSSDKTS